MNLSEISELCNVIKHLKEVIVTANISRFNKETLSSLNKRLSKFEDTFIEEVLHFGETTPVAIRNAISEARTKLVSERPKIGINELDIIEKSVPVESVVATPEEKKSFESKEKEVELKKKNGRPKVSKAVNDPYLEDSSLAELLKIEKEKVASKKK
jgi:hypothetical protein